MFEQFEHTADVGLRIRADDLNTLFSLLDQRGIRVTSLRNKANRLEELFMRLVDGDQQDLRA